MNSPLGAWLWVGGMIVAFAIIVVVDTWTRRRYNLAAAAILVPVWPGLVALALAAAPFWVLHRAVVSLRDRRAAAAPDLDRIERDYAETVRLIDRDAA